MKPKERKRHACKQKLIFARQGWFQLCHLQATMEHCAFVCLLFVCGVFARAQTAEIQTPETVVAAAGGEARLSCQLRQSTHVLQVTWQKISPEAKTNIASYNKNFGQTVNPGVRDRIEFEDAELQNNSIVMRNLTELDEGCYLCVFSTFPDGALTGRTCLRIYELHQPLLHVRASDSPEESVVSCSATGRPAPTVTLTVSLQHLNFSHYNTVSVNNTDGTVTVNTTAVLSGVRDDSVQVGCAVRVLSGPQKEAFVMIPELKRTSADGFTWIVVLCVCGCVAVVIIAVVLKLIKKKNNASGTLR
ncbi:OX-2 membrane glycoprotein-like [Odontesthes bonariensis]|uniref:OX-2 membrane glycoprotein-like n=1 Tax=Odontesthes bonariensis TaxID=219752 RepID=UPI003F58BF19